MVIGQKSLKGHLPRTQFGRNISALFEALGFSVERLRLFLMEVIAESNPGTAVDTLPEWYQQSGIRYDSTLPLELRQARAKQAHTAVGGQSPGYLNDQIQIAYPDIKLQEVYINSAFMAGVGMAGVMMAMSYPSWLPSPLADGEYPNFYYRVIGEVDYAYDLYSLKNLLDHIMPAPYEPVFAVTVRNLTPTSMAGIGMAGLMMAGREE